MAIDLEPIIRGAVEFASHNPEATLGIVGVAVLGMAFTVAQKIWIKHAMGDKCAAEEIGMRGEHEGGLEVHHRVPQLYAYEALGLTEEQVDSPYNSDVICHGHHVGRSKDVIHPDQQEALEEFRAGNKDAFKVLQKMRHDKVAKGEEYWDSTWDTRMAAHNTAHVNRYVKKSRLPFPFHKHKNE